MTMNSKREGIKRWWGGYPAGNDNRRDRRTARARGKVVTQREAFPVVAEEPFERCPSCGERYCDGCYS